MSILHTNWTPGAAGHIAEHNEIAARLINVMDYGAVGNANLNELATDDTAAIQAAIDAAILARNGVVVFPSAGGYKITDSLIIQPESGQSEARVSFICHDDLGLCWNGANNESVIITRGWRRSRVENLTIAIGGDGVVCWDITDPTGAISSSHLTFDTCTCKIFGHNDIGWRGGALDSTGSDISFLTFVNCQVLGWPAYQDSIGWDICHANCLNWTWYGGSGSYLAVMVQAEIGTPNGGGSMFFYGLGATHNLLEFRPGGSGAWLISGGRFEVGECFLSCGVYDGGNSYPMNITVQGAEIAQYTPADGILFMMGTPGSLVLDNVCVTYTDDTAEWDADMITLGGSTDGYGSLIVRGGSIKTASAADPFYTIGRGIWCVRVEDVGKVNSSGNVIGRYRSHVFDAPAYGNAGGRGNRGMITVTTDLTGGITAHWALVDGNLTEEANYYWTTGNNPIAGKYIQFQFPGAVRIVEAKFYRADYGAYPPLEGVWQWKGSQDGTTWVDIGATFTPGTGEIATMTTLSGNTTAYVHYGLFAVSGSFSGTVVPREFEFKLTWAI